MLHAYIRVMMMWEGLLCAYAAFYCVSGPFVKHTKSSLKINNPNDKRIAFAIKTTAPRIFTVSPNSSIVQPHEEILVESMQ